MFTGRYPESHTATGKVSILPDDVVTFAELLRDGGYYTKGFSNNPNICGAFNFGQGFVEYTDLKPSLYFGARESAARLSIYQILRIVRHAVMSRVSGKMSVTDFYQPADVVTREALGWLDSGTRPGEAPFFLFAHYMDPHDPFMDHNKPGAGYARSVLQPPTPTGVESKKIDPAKYLQPMIDAYNSEIEFLDGHLGAFFDGLRSRGLYDNSAIVFVSDHGEEFYDHEGWWHGQTLFDEVVRVPLILKLPSNAGAGQHNTGFARHIDLAPTLLGLAGLQPDANMPGKPLLGADGSFLNGDIAYVYAENDFENNTLQSLRTHTEKIIHANADNPRGHAPREFYDLTADPGEKNNLAETGGPRVAGVETLLEGMIAFIATGAAEPAMTVVSEDTRQQLDSLGYTGLGELKSPQTGEAKTK
jgi:arylsulfatase A-like enzyme